MTAEAVAQALSGRKADGRTLIEAAELYRIVRELPAIGRQQGHGLSRGPRQTKWTRSPDRLPFVRLGRVPYLHIPSSKAWIESRIHRPNPVRAARRNRDIKTSR